MDYGELAILYEDNHLIAVDKPAGLLSQPDDTGDESLDVLVREWIRVKYSKPGNVYLGLLHRLDRPTSGVVLLARTEKAAGRMADLFRRREVSKTYYAVVENVAGLTDSGVAVDFLSENGSGGMSIVRGGGSGAGGSKEKARRAELGWRVLSRVAGGRGVLEIDLRTGVKHQIRVQLAGRGCPVVGDFRYGGRGGAAAPVAVAGGRGILLHAGAVSFVHPVRGEEVSVRASVPGFWGEYGGRVL